MRRTDSCENKMHAISMNDALNLCLNFVAYLTRHIASVRISFCLIKKIICGCWGRVTVFPTVWHNNEENGNSLFLIKVSEIVRRVKSADIIEKFQNPQLFRVGFEDF